MESGKWKVENGEWKVESEEWKVESGKWKVESGERGHPATFGVEELGIRNG